MRCSTASGIGDMAEAVSLDPFSLAHISNARLRHSLKGMLRVARLEQECMYRLAYSSAECIGKYRRGHCYACKHGMGLEERTCRVFSRVVKGEMGSVPVSSGAAKSIALY